MTAAPAVTSRPPAHKPRSRSGHRVRVMLAAWVAAALVIAVALYGLDYYPLSRAPRVFAPKHGHLRPSGTIGLPLGVLGALLFLGIYLYPIRKRWPWLARKGKTKHWLDFHMLMGLAAPAIITLHSSFKFQGIAGAAYWIMLSVVLSGIVGRYFYGQIPRRLDAAEMSLEEMRALSVQLAEQIEAQAAIPRDAIEPLLRLPGAEEVRALPLRRALWLMIALDLKRPWLLWRLRRAGAAVHRPEFREVLAAVRRQAGLAKRIVFLSKAQQIFHMWHVVHRPFSYSFAVLSLLHIAIVLLLGCY